MGVNVYGGIDLEMVASEPLRFLVLMQGFHIGWIAKIQKHFLDNTGIVTIRQGIFRRKADAFPGTPVVFNVFHVGGA